MSRFYKLVVGPETSTPVGAAGPSNLDTSTWTNMVSNQADLGAQTIEFTVASIAADAPMEPAWIRLWGPSKEQVSQSTDYNGAHIDLYAGMQKGLPLANSDQQGLILSGQVFQAYGNWQGINQTLEFVVVVDGGATQDKPAKLAFIWKQGDKLKSVIQSTLQAAYPHFKLDIKISDDLVLPQDEQGVYQTLQQFSEYVKGISIDILGQGDNNTYKGISIVPNNGAIQVFDGTQKSDQQTTAITVQDLVGQPTWLDAFTIQFNTVLRADLRVGSIVSFPPIAGATALTTPQSGSNVRNKNAFSGDWTISLMRHIGNSRAADAQSWISTFQAYSNQAPGVVG